MGALHNLIEKHVLTLDNCLDFDRITGKRLVDWFTPLVNSFTEDGAIPYLLNTKDRYRASPLSSLIVWLNMANLLPKEATDILFNKLIHLRDNCEFRDLDKGVTQKNYGDEMGWSLCEGVSVWSTSMALMAILGSNYGIDQTKVNKIKKSILWLVRQQNSTKKGWAYQSYRNCQVNVPMTALALYALSLAYAQRRHFNFRGDETNLLLSAISQGFEYLNDNCKANNKKGHCYWEFNGKFSCFATTWSLMAIRKISQLDTPISDTAKENFYDIKVKCFDCILSNMPKNYVCWESELFVYEAGAKYNKQKNYYSFTPTLLLLLMDLGLSPYHPKVINQIRWLIHNPSQWKITQYDQENICSFTYAMCVATIVKWLQCVSYVNSDLINEKSNKVYDLIVGMPPMREQPVILLKKSRLWHLGVVAVIICIAWVGGPYVFEKIKQAIMCISKLRDGIMIDLITTAICSAIVYVITRIFSFLRNIYGKKYDK